MEKNLFHFLSNLIEFKVPDKSYWTHNTMKNHSISPILTISSLVHNTAVKFALIPLITDYFCYFTKTWFFYSLPFFYSHNPTSNLQAKTSPFFGWIFIVQKVLW